MAKLIADISHYVTVEDWKKIKETCPFLICKATQGTRIVDSYLDTFIKGCEANHIPYWLYTYIEYATDGTAQAKYLINKTKDKVGPYFIGYAVDAEVNSEKSSRVEIRGKLPEESEVRKTIMYIKGLGSKCLFYGNDYLGLIKEIRDKNCAIWYPRYGKDTGEYDPAYPVKKTYEPYADMHQYTSKGTCPGLSAECDLNRLTGKRDLSWFTTRDTKEEDKTVIKIGSARIDENGKATGGKAGDQTGKEVSEQAFYMHSKGWLCFRAKDVFVANALAKAMQDACANNNIGYDQGNRAIMTMLKKYGSMAKIAEKTETDCSNLVRGCIYQATGIDVGNFNTATEPAVLRKSGLFNEIEIKSEKDVYNGDVLVTKAKGHTVIATSGRARSGKVYTGEWPKLPARGWFKNGDVSAEVCKLKKFLNWFGNYGLTETNKNYLSKTVAAVKDFQKKAGETVDGEFGSKSLAAAKNVKK